MINRFSDDWFELKLGLFCGGGGGGGGGGDSMDDDPDGDFDAMGGSAGDFEGTNFGGDSATAGGDLGGGGGSGDRDAIAAAAGVSPDTIVGSGPDGKNAVMSASGPVKSGAAVAAEAERQGVSVGEINSRINEAATSLSSVDPSIAAPETPDLIDSYLNGPMMADISTPMTGGAFVDPTTGYGIMSDIPGAAAQSAMDYTNAIATGQRGPGNMAMTTGDLSTGTGGARFAGIGFDDPLGYYNEGDIDITAVDPSFDLGFADTEVEEPEIASPRVQVTPPSVASDVDLSMLQAINQERLASGGTRQVDRTYTPSDRYMGQGTGVESLTGDALRDALLGPAPETKTLGESLIDDLFEELNPGPESFTPESLTPDTNVPPTGEITISGPQGVESSTTLGETPADTAGFSFTRDVLGVDQSVPQMSLAPETMPSQFDRQARMGEVQGPMSMAPVEATRFSGIDMMRQADDVLAERAIDEAIFGDTSDIALPSLRAGAEIINQLETAFGANQAQKIADVAARPGGAVVRDPQTGEVLGAVGPESNLSSALFGASDAVYVGDPRGYDQGVEIGKSILGPDTNVRDVPTQDPFGGGMEGRPGADYTTTAPAPGSDGDARQAQTTEPDITCPEGFEYDPVSDSCVVKEPAPRIYGGPASVNIAAPTLTQYTQMAAPRPTALQPSQLIAPRPIDPLTGRPFAKGGIVNAAKFHEGGMVDLAEQTMQSIVGLQDEQDWMDVNKDGKVNISDSVALLKVGAGVAEQDPNAQVTANDINYLKGLTEAGLIQTGDFVGAIGNYIGTEKDGLSSAVTNALANRDMLTGQSFANYLSPEQIEEQFGTYVDPTQFEGYVDPTTYAQTTGQLSDLQAQLAGMEGYVDPSQFEGYVDPTTYAQTTGQVETLQGQLTGLQGQLDQKVADYDALSKTYGTSQADLDRAAAEIQQLQSTIGDLQGQQESTRQQAVAQQYAKAPDYSQYTQPAQSFMPQAAQTTPYTQFAPPAGIAGLQPTLAPTLASPQFIQQPTLDIPMLELAQLDPTFMPMPYAPPELYNPFAPVR